MSKIEPQEYELKNGEKLVIRTALPDDARALLEYAHVIFAEDLYNVTTLGEFKKSVEEEREWIQAHYDKPAHLALTGEVNGSLVGFLSFENGSRKRLAHQGTLHMGVLPQFRNKGIGTALLKSLIGWAKENHLIEKVTLEVFVTNEAAIRLYRKMGFLEEGRRVRHVKIADGKYVDVIVMYVFVKD